MSAKLMWPIEEAPPPVQVPQHASTARGQSRTEQEHQTSVMLLEAVACLRELSDIVLRHERILTAKNPVGLAAGTAQGAPAPSTFRQPDELDDILPESQAALSPLTISDQNPPRIDAPLRKPLPPTLSFLLSGVASVSGLALAYALFLR
jgi:hypothetical protein